MQVLVVGLGSGFYARLRSLARHQSDFQWVRRVHTLAEAVERTKHRLPDIVLLPLPVTDPDHKGLLHSLLGGESPPRLLAVCCEVNTDLQCEALCMGASALISWDSPTEFVISAIRQVCRGEEPIEYSLLGSLVLAGAVHRRLKHLSQHSIGDPPTCHLSERELEIVAAVSCGQTNREIGYEMGVNEQTVKNYMSGIMKRLEARDRAHAVTLALSYGWIPTLKSRPRSATAS